MANPSPSAVGLALYKTQWPNLNLGHAMEKRENGHTVTVRNDIIISNVYVVKIYFKDKS